MFSKAASVLTLSLGLLSTASAVAVATPQSGSGDNAWHISNFDASCANGRCRYQFQVDSGGIDGYPAFTATCQGRGIPRADKTLRTCSINYGNNDGVQIVQAFMELTPLRPNNPSEFHITVGYSDQYSGSVTYYEASQYGNYQSWRDYSVSGIYAGYFDVYPTYSAAVA